LISLIFSDSERASEKISRNLIGQLLDITMPPHILQRVRKINFKSNLPQNRLSKQEKISARKMMGLDLDSIMRKLLKEHLYFLLEAGLTQASGIKIILDQEKLMDLAQDLINYQVV
jgi:hypothetical protein